MSAQIRMHRAPRIVVLLLVLGFIGLLPTTAGQDSAGLAAKVSAVLVKFPAESAAERNAAAAELLSLGPEGLQSLGRRLAPPGKDDDSLARFALDAAAVYAARPGAESERRMFCREVLRVLEMSRETEVKAFLLGELQRVGKEEVVRPVGALLADARLAGPAARVLAAVRNPEAERTLIRALRPESRGTALSVVQALGDMRSVAAVKSLLPLASGKDADLRRAAIAALANIGDPAARLVLEKSTVTASSFERAQAASLYLLFARRLHESGNAELAAPICREFIANYTLPGESQVRTAALALLAEIQGPSVLDVLLEAVGTRDPAFREKALELTMAIPGEPVTSRLVEKAAPAEPDVQADIIASLGGRGDKSALPAVRERLKSENKAVRLAAVSAAVRLGGAGVLDEIWPLMATDDEDQARVVRNALTGFPTEQVVPRAAEMLAEAPPAARAALIELFAERRARAQAGIVLIQAGSEDAVVRKAALAALETLVRGEDMPKIIELILASSAAPETTLLQTALVAAAGELPDPEKRADAVLASLYKAPAEKRGDLIRPLARIGGANALAYVADKLADPEPPVRAAALYALSNWADTAALDELFKAARSAADRRTRYMALQGIARLSGGKGLSDERKLTALKSAREIAVENDEKNVLVTALGSVRTLESLKILAGFLDAPATRVRAAQAVLRAVLPSPGVAGLNGFETARVLKKALLFIDSDYDRDQAEAYARKLLFQEGFSFLFNGKDLSGWKGLVTDPPQRAKMAPSALKRAQAEADALMRAHWKVIEGGLAFDGKGHSLCTARDYADYEMFVDWKIEPKGDSGIYLRGSPQVQIWDLTQSPDGSGGLYNNKNNPSKPLIRADLPVGEWNTFYIRMAGDRVTVELNGVVVTDNVIMENYWEREKPIYPSGQIELQAHSTPLNFRNIYIREIPRAPAAPPTPAQGPVSAAEEGFVPLFNGRDLIGWTGDTTGYKVEDGKIVVSPEGGGNLFTGGEFKDFIFRFEFRLAAGANNGIGIRAPLTGDAAYAGMEIQVLDDSAEVYRNLKPYQYHGSIYGVVPARRGALKPVGEWNAEEIAVKGRRVTVTLNGTTIVDDDIDLASAGGTSDHREHPGLKNETGHIGFLGHGTRVEFRNIRIRDLSRRPAPSGRGLPAPPDNR